MSYFQGIVYLSEEQFAELRTNGTLTVGEETIIYNEDTVYVTPEVKETPDTTLSVSGKAADAAAVGAKIAEVQASAKLYKHEISFFTNAYNIRYNITLYLSKSTACKMLTDLLNFGVTDMSILQMAYYDDLLSASGVVSCMYAITELIDIRGVITNGTDIIPVKTSLYEADTLDFTDIVTEI